MRLFARDIGIDLGTANTLVHVQGKGIVIREPSVVAIDKRSGAVHAVGEAAKNMIGRTPGNIVAIRPMKDGVIADFDVTQAMLKHFIQKAYSGGILGRPRVVVCVPSCVTEVEKRAVEEATIQAGAREAYLMEEPMAAAIGAGLPVEDPTGSIVVDIGGGTSDVAVISLGGIVTAKSIRIAGDELDDAIIYHIKKEYNLMIGERTAEDIKLNIGCAYKKSEKEIFEIRGRDLLNGLPKNIAISSDEILEALREPVAAIIDCIKTTLEKTPPELSADIMDKGIMLTGGGALLWGLDQLISEETGIPVKIADKPLDCVVLGTERVLEGDGIDIMKKVLISSKKAR